MLCSWGIRKVKRLSLKHASVDLLNSSNFGCQVLSLILRKLWIYRTRKTVKENDKNKIEFWFLPVCSVVKFVSLCGNISESINIPLCKRIPLICLLIGKIVTYDRNLFGQPQESKISADDDNHLLLCSPFVLFTFIFRDFTNYKYYPFQNK